MIFLIIHIVREHERLQDILKNYNVEIDDLKTNNLHITDFNHLTPGTKLRIPNLNQETIQILNEVEPLVSNYYKPDFDESNIINDDGKKVDVNDTSEPKIKPRGFNLFPPKGFNNPFRGPIYPHGIKNKKSDN